MLGSPGALLAPAAPTRRPARRCCAALPHNVTTEMDLELWRLAERIRADPASAAAHATRAGDLARGVPRRHAARRSLQNGLADFLRRYGHRAVAEIDLGMPRWSEDPTHLLGVLANYLRLDDPALAPDGSSPRRARRRGGGRSDVAAAGGPAGSRWRAGPSRFAAAPRARAGRAARERPKYPGVALLAAARAELQRGRRRAGRTPAASTTADDVFFLDLPRPGGRSPATTCATSWPRRRAEYDAANCAAATCRACCCPTAPNPRRWRRRRRAADGALRGTPASAGTVTAPARVVLDPAGAHLEPGEILVAPSTDPGWTPLFLTAGGLVMEMGGAKSHGAVVAREYGIPAVVGVPDATSRISTGDRVTVDGAAGSVLVPCVTVIPTRPRGCRHAVTTRGRG